MNIYNYIDNYSMKTFDEYPFNDIDAVLFSFISYVDYGKIVEDKKILLTDVGRMHFGLHNKEEKNIIAVRDATNLLNYIKDTNRYKNCYLYNYVYDIKNDIQFSAICIEYQKNKVYVSYEGTNALISGWKENFVLSYSFPTLSHIKAIEYLNKHFTFSRKELILGGHSKGGNLALVAGMKANFLVRSKIKEIYNIDGPGLLDKEYKSKSYQRILHKYKQILPDNSLVGIIMNSSNRKVIQTSIVGPLAHDILYWNIEKDHFIPSKLSEYSKELSIALKKYQKKHTKEEIEKAIQDIYSVIVESNIIELQDLKSFNNIKSLITNSKKLDDNSRTLFLELIGTFIKSLGSTIYNRFQLLTIIKK